MTSLRPRFDEYKEIRMVFPGMDLFFHSGDSSFIGSGDDKEIFGIKTVVGVFIDDFYMC